LKKKSSTFSHGLETKFVVPSLQKPIRTQELFEALKNLVEEKPLYLQKLPQDATKPMTTLLGQLYRMHILVAEDNTINQKLIFNILKKMGYYCDMVANGKEVLEALNNKFYHIIFMDVQMPEMDGIEATKQIHHLEKLKIKPIIIAMTAHVGMTEKGSYEKLGMDDYVSKPIDINQLKITLEKWGKKWVPQE